MWGRLGPRFAVEALFLVLVAVGLGFADLRPLVIVLVMAGAWLLVSLIEFLASRAPRYAPLVEAPAEAPAAAPPAAPGGAAVGADTEPGIPPDVEAPPAVDEEVVEEPVAVASEAEVVEPGGVIAAPRPRRGWFRWRRDPAAGDPPPEGPPPESSADPDSPEAPEDAAPADEPLAEDEPAERAPSASAAGES